MASACKQVKCYHLGFDACCSCLLNEAQPVAMQREVRSAAGQALQTANGIKSVTFA
jgi:hypothetical protein